MASSKTILTVLPTARPWNFAAIGAVAGAHSSHVGYNVNYTDGSNAGGTGSENQAFAYGQQHASDTAPHTVAVNPFSVCLIQYTGGSARWFASGTLYGPSGDTSGSAVVSPSVDYTDANGYVQPTDCMPAAHNIAGVDPTIGTVGLCGVFTDAPGNVIDKSFWDWKNNVIPAIGLVLTKAQPTGTTFPISINTNTTFSAGSITLTGTWLGGAGGAYVGLTFVTSGYTSAGNNSGPGGFPCTASAAGSITLTDAGGASSNLGSPVADPGTGAVTLYTGTITGGTANALVGNSFTITGFDTNANNGTFTCVASTLATLTLQNFVNSQVTDTYAGNAQGAQSIALTAPTGAAFLSIGIDDSELHDNGGHGFDITVNVLDAVGRYAGSHPDYVDFPIGIFCRANFAASATYLTTSWMNCVLHPLYDTAANMILRDAVGQLFPHGSQNTGSAPAGSNGQNFPY